MYGKCFQDFPENNNCTVCLVGVICYMSLFEGVINITSKGWKWCFLPPLFGDVYMEEMNLGNRVLWPPVDWGGGFEGWEPHPHGERGMGEKTWSFAEAMVGSDVLGLHKWGEMTLTGVTSLLLGCFFPVITGRGPSCVFWASNSYIFASLHDVAYGLRNRTNCAAHVRL